MRVVVVTPPQPVVSLDEAKLHLRVDGGDEDALIETFIAAATGHIDGPDGWLGRAIGVQTLEFGLDGFCHTRFPLPFPPIVAVNAVVYDDAHGVERVLDPSVYEVRDGWVGTAWGQQWPSTRICRGASRTVRVRYQAGYPDLPPAIRVAILLMVADMYRDRDAPAGPSALVESLLQPLRIYG